MTGGQRLGGQTRTRGVTGLLRGLAGTGIGTAGFSLAVGGGGGAVTTCASSDNHCLRRDGVGTWDRSRCHHHWSLLRGRYTLLSRESLGERITREVKFIPKVPS